MALCWSVRFWKPQEMGFGGCRRLMVGEEVSIEQISVTPLLLRGVDRQLLWWMVSGQQHPLSWGLSDTGVLAPEPREGTTPLGCAAALEGAQGRRVSEAQAQGWSRQWAGGVGKDGRGPRAQFEEKPQLRYWLIYAVCGYKEHLNVQHVTFCFPTTAVCLNW